MTPGTRSLSEQFKMVLCKIDLTMVNFQSYVNDPKIVLGLFSLQETLKDTYLVLTLLS